LLGLAGTAGDSPYARVVLHGLAARVEKIDAGFDFIEVDAEKICSAYPLLVWVGQRMPAHLAFEEPPAGRSRTL